MLAGQRGDTAGACVGVGRGLVTDSGQGGGRGSIRRSRRAETGAGGRAVLCIVSPWLFRRSDAKMAREHGAAGVAVMTAAVMDAVVVTIGRAVCIGHGQRRSGM